MAHSQSTAVPDRIAVLNEAVEVLSRAIAQHRALIDEAGLEQKKVYTPLNLSAVQLLLEASAASASRATMSPPPSNLMSPPRPNTQPSALTHRSVRQLRMAEDTDSASADSQSRTSIYSAEMLPRTAFLLSSPSPGITAHNSNSSTPAHGSGPATPIPGATHSGPLPQLSQPPQSHASKPTQPSAAQHQSSPQHHSLHPQLLPAHQSSSRPQSRSQARRPPALSLGSASTTAVPPPSLLVNEAPAAMAEPEVPLAAIKALERLLLDRNAVVLRSLLEVMELSAQTPTAVRHIILLASARGCALSLVVDCLHRMVHQASMQSQNFVADVLEWWVDPELQARTELRDAVVAAEALVAYCKVHFSRSLRPAVLHAVSRAQRAMMGLSTGGSPAVSTASSGPTSPISSVSASSAPGHWTAATSPSLHITSSGAGAATAGASGTLGHTAGTTGSGAAAGSKPFDLLADVAAEFLAALIPDQQEGMISAYAPSLHRVLREVVVAFELLRRGSGIVGLVGVLTRGLLPAVSCPFDYGLPLLVETSVSSTQSQGGSGPLPKLSGRPPSMMSVTGNSSASLLHSNSAVGFFGESPAGSMSGLNANTMTTSTTTTSIHAATQLRRVAERLLNEALDRQQSQVDASSSTLTRSSASSTAGAEEVALVCHRLHHCVNILLTQAAPDGPCVAIWELERITHRRGWASVYRQAVENIRSAMLDNFEQISPALESEMATEIFEHSVADRFSVVWSLLEPEPALIHTPMLRSPSV